MQSDVGVLTGEGFEEGRPEPGHGEHESATLEVRGTHSGTAADSADVTATSGAVAVPFASSEDDRNLQTVGISSLRPTTLLSEMSNNVAKVIRKLRMNFPEVFRSTPPNQELFFCILELSFWD